MANDTTTQLNPGTGGDQMDETLAPQLYILNADGTYTQVSAKRPRVVPGGDDGSLQTFDKGPDSTAANVSDRDVESLMFSMLIESKRQTALLRLILSRMGDTRLDLDTIDAFAQDGDN